MFSPFIAVHVVYTLFFSSVEQGTPFQVILALLICLMNAMLLLRYAPYRTQQADTLSIICAVALSLSVLGGYVLMANDCVDCLTKGTVNPIVMDVMLVVLNVFPCIVFAVNMVRLKLGSSGVLLDHQKHIHRSGESSTAVVPMDAKKKSVGTNEDQEIKNWK